MLKSAFIFPGQSSQRVGMLQELYTESEIVRQTFEEASDILRIDVPGLCFAGSESDLRDIRISAPLIVSAGVASFRHLEQRFHQPPALMAGHSLGEYAALACAGVMTLSRVLPAVVFRSELAVRAALEQDGVMSVVYRVKSAQVEDWCAELRLEGKRVWASCLNAPDQLSIAGARTDVETVERLASRKGASVKRIEGNAPFHTPMMEKAAEEFEYYLRGLPLSAPLRPVIANVDAQCYIADDIVDKLVRQLVRPVQWNRTMEYALKQNIECCVELGSGQILTSLARTRFPDIGAFAYERKADRDRLYGRIEAEATARL